MATNAQSASLLKRKHQSSKSGDHERAVLQRPFMLQPFKVQKYFKPCMFSFLELQQIASAIISYSVWEIPLNSSMRLLSGHMFGMSSLIMQGCSKIIWQQMKIHLNAALDMTIFIQMVHFFPSKCTPLSFVMKLLLFLTLCISICWKTVLVNLESNAFHKTLFRFFYFEFVTG